MKVILSLICLCFWVHSYAQFDDSKIESTLSEDQKKELKKNYLKDTKSDHELAVKLMRLDFAPYIKKLNRDIVTYNYRMPNEFSSKDNSAIDMKSDSQDAIEYASKWAKAAKNQKKYETGMYGWGLYTARDPFASLMYAEGSNLRLVTVKFPKDGNMLDLRKLEYSLPVSKETVEVLNKLCPDIFITGDTGKMRKTILTGSEACHKVYNEVMDSFNIQGVIYAWQSVSNKQCDNTTHDSSAFVAYNLKIDESSIDFIMTLPPKVKEEAQEIQRTKDQSKRAEKIKKFSLGEKTFNDYERISSYMQAVPWMSFHPANAQFRPFFSNDTEQKKKFSEIYKEETFACDKKYQEDDKITYKPEQAWEVLLEDSKIIETLSDGLKSVLENCKKNP